MQRLAGFFEHAGLDAAAWEACTQMVRSASGKAIGYGTPSPSQGTGVRPCEDGLAVRPGWSSLAALPGRRLPRPEEQKATPDGVMAVA